MLKECSLIQELLPLYAENLVSAETDEYIRKHLAGCTSCAQDWDSFIEPLPDPLPRKNLVPEKGGEKTLFTKLKKTVAVAVLLLIMGGTGLAYASYNAGKHMGMSDPAYRFAQELGLFTEINQTKIIDGIQVSMDKGLFDTTRSVLFFSLSDANKTMPQVKLVDQDGRQYDQKSGRGWQNKSFMIEFEPVGSETQEVCVSLSLDESEGAWVDFTFPVDVVKTAQYTRIIYPNQEKKLSDLKITLDKAVLGVSESEFKVYFDWPVDGSVAGFGIGRGTAYFPTSVEKAPETPPPPGMAAPPPGGLMSGYAAAYGVGYRPEDPPVDRPALYDLTVRQEVEVQGGEYKTTQFPCQVMAALKFAPMKQETEQMELLLPPVYLYQKAADLPKLHLDFHEKSELNLEASIPFKDKKLIVEKAWLENNSVYISYRIESPEDPETNLPHFELTDTQGMKQVHMRFDRDNPQVIIFSLYHEEEEGKEFYLNLDSIGQLLSREKFTLDLQGE
ncbi:MAG: zf-HC2 domain-containing protein [Dehalobacterium sp.]